MLSLGLIYSFLFFSNRNLFLVNSKRHQINQYDRSLNRGLSLGFWWLRRTSHGKFTEKYEMSTEIFSVKKQSTNGLNISLPLRKSFHGVEIH